MSEKELSRFDPTRMNEVAEQAGQSAIVYELVNLFLKDVAERLIDLELAVQQANLQLLERVGHSIKGSCANLGAERMAAMAKSIERTTIQAAPEQLRAIAAEFEALKLVLRQHYP